MDFTIKRIVGVSLVCLLSAVMASCTIQNTPTDPSGEGKDTTGTSPVDTTITTTDTISITWSGANASIIGSHDGVSVTDNNGKVSIVSTVKDITYLLSGTGNGSLHIEGTNRHQLILNDLALTCSDGPAINNQCKKSCFVVLQGANSLTDGSSYAESTEDQKAAFFSEGQMIFSGGGSLTVKGNYKHALASDDYIQFAQSTGSLNLTAVSDGIHANDGIYFDGGTITISAGSDGIQCDTASITINGGSITITKAEDKGITAYGDITITDGTLRITSQYKCLKAGKKENNKIVSAGNISISGGDVQCICTGTSSGGGWGGSSSDSSSPEAIEAKGTITISSGQIYAQSYDDAINSGGDMTISGGFVCAYATNNDGLDANGNCYIKGGLVYAIGSSSPEMAIDANTEGGKKLYISGGTIIAIGNLENGASISGGTCQSTSSWSESQWYALYNNGELVTAFKTPAASSSGRNWAPPGGGGGGGSNTQKLIVYTSSTPTLMSNVTVNNGTEILNGMMNPTGSVNGGSNVSLSNYSSSGR